MAMGKPPRGSYTSLSPFTTKVTSATVWPGSRRSVKT